MIDQGLRTLLMTEAAITAIAASQTVGQVSIPAIFVDSPAQGVTPPYIIITITGGDRLNTLDSTYSHSLKMVEIDIDSFSYDKTQAASLDAAITDFLDDYTGAAGGSDTIKSVYADHPVSGYDFPNEGDDKKAFYVTTTCSIMYSTP